MKAWAVEELQYAQLGDVRRKKRLIRIVSDLAAQPNASVPQASGDLAATQAAYEFWKSPYVKPEAITSAHQSSTVERVKKESVVIAIQDTTELNFTHHPATQGMGYLDHAKSYGLKVHSVFCTTGNGVPLGVLHQQVWARDMALLGKKHQRHKKPITDKESQRWLLLTTLAIACFEDVVQCLRWYSYRWLIERYHYVLKSGCRLEQLQLESADRIHARFSHLHDCRLALIVDDLLSSLPS
jgi:hypothetical protein